MPLVALGDAEAHGDVHGMTRRLRAERSRALSIRIASLRRLASILKTLAIPDMYICIVTREGGP